MVRWGLGHRERKSSGQEARLVNKAVSNALRKEGVRGPRYLWRANWGWET